MNINVSVSYLATYVISDFVDSNLIYLEMLLDLTNKPTSMII